MEARMFPAQDAADVESVEGGASSCVAGDEFDVAVAILAGEDGPQERAVFDDADFQDLAGGDGGVVGLELLPGEGQLVPLVLFGRRRRLLADLFVALPGRPLAPFVAVDDGFALGTGLQLLGAAALAAPRTLSLVDAIAVRRRRDRGDSVEESLRIFSAPFHDAAGWVLFLPGRVDRAKVAVFGLQSFPRLGRELVDVGRCGLSLAHQLCQPVFRFLQIRLIHLEELDVAVASNRFQPTQGLHALRRQLLDPALRLAQPSIDLHHLVHLPKVITTLVASITHVQLTETPTNLVRVHG
mmetsp:Transcript_34668/g.111250  ORF Transcript_34668/g.111250 Transcript_34668/m.111250 type:complete len:297 (+) Transcript_34668:191-1081(+)